MAKIIILGLKMIENGASKPLAMLSFVVNVALDAVVSIVSIAGPVSTMK